MNLLRSILHAAAAVVWLGLVWAGGGCATSAPAGSASRSSPSPWARSGALARPVAPKAVVARPAPKPAGQLAPRTAPPPGLAYDVLRVGDKLTVRLSDIPNPPEPIEQRVREDGMITLTQGIQVVAANKKPADVEAAIIREYVPKFYTRITVSVKSEERAFYVDGEVKTPNRYVYAAEMTVLKAISVAGGFTEFANKTNVEVTRINGEKPIIVDCKKALRIPKLDIPIYPGDHVFVRKRWM